MERIRGYLQAKSASNPLLKSIVSRKGRGYLLVPTMSNFSFTWRHRLPFADFAQRESLSLMMACPREDVCNAFSGPRQSARREFGGPHAVEMPGQAVMFAQGLRLAEQDSRCIRRTK